MSVPLIAFPINLSVAMALPEGLAYAVWGNLFCVSLQRLTSGELYPCIDALVAPGIYSGYGKELGKTRRRVLDLV
jgi:hypothetical protein